MKIKIIKITSVTDITNFVREAQKVYGDITVKKGRYVVDGKSLKTSTEKELQEYRSSYLGFIFQDFLLLNEFTVCENINLALNISGIQDESLIDDSLQKVDLLKEKDKFPAELSGGQRQRVAIARALVKNPKMLLCDEPTGNLDYKTSAFILKFLKEQSKEKLVIIVSHNIEDAEIRLLLRYKYEDELKSDEIDEIEDEIKELEEELEDYEEKYVYGIKGKIVWYGTADAVEDSK